VESNILVMDTICVLTSVVLYVPEAGDSL